MHNIVYYIYFIVQQPPENTRLILNWDGAPVEFNSSAVYQCESDDIYFEIDKDLEGYNITCLEDGSWDVPEIWPVCLPCIFRNISEKLFI
jgi:hypothetical protein